MNDRWVEDLVKIEDVVEIKEEEGRNLFIKRFRDSITNMSEIRSINYKSKR